MIASLPMYDRPENRAAHDALWDGIRAQLGYGPDRLDRDSPYNAGWGRDDLLLGQICNLPYRTQFRDTTTRIACVDYGLQDTPAGYYQSVFVVRNEDAARGFAPACLGRFAYNDALSHSGWGAPLAVVTAQGLKFHSTLRTGAHIDSMNAVVRGDADLTAIDAVTWRMLQAWEPEAANLTVIGHTRASPGMTFITAKGNDPAPLLVALQTAIAELDATHAQTLGLKGVVVLPDAAYDIPCAAPPHDAPPNGPP